jgi:hypothetical protein
MVRSSILATLLIIAPVATTATQAMQRGASFTVDVVQDPPASQPVGTPLQWTIATSSSNTMSYRLTIGRERDENLVLIDYGRSNVFEWTPLEEGSYVVKAFVRDETTGDVARGSASLHVLSPVTDSPVVTLTQHPLVALFSSPPCAHGLKMRVLYKPSESRTLDATLSKPCDGVMSMNFFVPGLVERWMYEFRAELLKNDTEPYDYGPVLTLQAGASEATLPVRRTTISPTAQSSMAEDVLLQSPAQNTVRAGASGESAPTAPWATDLSGRVLWYYGGDPNDRPSLIHPVPGGTFFITLGEEGLEGQLLQEIDVLGNVVRETNRRRVSEQLLAMGHDEIGAFHHDAIRLPDGRTAVIASVERLLEGVQGPQLVDILGDMVVVLDRNWQVDWAWNSFDHLDVTRQATLNETCARGEPGCPPFFLADVVNDWTHTNTVTYSPFDGNLLLSVRNLDWVVKVDYRDGVGEGAVLWRLGPEGDFQIVADSNDPYPWLSHQHDPRFVDRDHIVIYDNGNTRCAMFPAMCFSRGQVYHIDQTNRVATLTLSFNLGSYAFALGSSQPLSNGNFHFNTGIEPNRQGPGFVATSDEVSSDGQSFVYAQRVEAEIYRSWRLTDLFMTGNSPESLAYAEGVFGVSTENEN